MSYVPINPLDESPDMTLKSLIFLLVVNAFIIFVNVFSQGLFIQIYSVTFVNKF